MVPFAAFDVLGCRVVELSIAEQPLPILFESFLCLYSKYFSQLGVSRALINRLGAQYCHAVQRLFVEKTSSFLCAVCMVSENDLLFIVRHRKLSDINCAEVLLFEAVAFQKCCKMDTTEDGSAAQGVDEVQLACDQYKQILDLKEIRDNGVRFIAT